VQNAEIVVATVAKVSNRRAAQDSDKPSKKKRKTKNETDPTVVSQPGQMSKLIKAFGERTDQLLHQVRGTLVCRVVKATSCNVWD
jgi:hypothetical protein